MSQTQEVLYNLRSSASDRLGMS